MATFNLHEDIDSALGQIAGMASRGLVALRAFADATGLQLDGDDADGYETALADLLGDLRHFCDVTGVDFYTQLERSYDVFYCNEVADARRDRMEFGWEDVAITLDDIKQLADDEENV